MRLVRLLLPLLFFPLFVFAQQPEEKPIEVDINYFAGSIIRHNKDISHLITGHPNGFLMAFNRKTYGLKDWEALYNFPDWGVSFSYQDLKNPYLGDVYSLYGHYGFYFLNRRLLTRIGTGIGYATSPFDIETNIKNNAYGSALMSSSFLMVQYRQRLSKHFSVQSGLTFLHNSNGNVKSPNTSTNTMSFSLGVLYQDQAVPKYNLHPETKAYKEPIHFNIALSGGLNESDYVNLGQFPFAVVSVFADKRINKKSTLIAGIEGFFSRFLKEEIEYVSIAFPGHDVSGNEDWKRVGAYIGHELHFGKMIIITHAGYYFYYPYDFEGRVYVRAGVKHYLSKRIFGSVAIKAHGAKAEAIEFGLGFRFNKL